MIKATTDANRAIVFRRAEFMYLTIGNRKYFTITNVANAIKMVLMVNKNIAPKKYPKLPVARPYPAVHKGGIKAVAIATPARFDH